MYLIRIDGGRGYTVEYPEFEGDGFDTVNEFYRHLAVCAGEYFESLTAEDRHNVCRCRFLADESEDGIAVTVVLTLRRSGRRIAEKTLSHRWSRTCGKEMLLMW